MAESVTLVMIIDPADTKLVLAINNPVAATKNDRITACHGCPELLLDAKAMIVGKLKAANIGAISRVTLSFPGSCCVLHVHSRGVSETLSLTGPVCHGRGPF